MLSYRHGYHAGNFADVLKHVVLTSILDYMTRKDAPLCYIDTHAGAGEYDLRSAFATKTGEARSGIAELWDADDAPQAVINYLDRVRKCNPSGALDKYPGSPWFAAAALRKQDRLMLCELHSSDFPLLEKLFARDRRVHCYREDGYRFSKGLVPPRERRGLILMDPSYELRDEYATAIASMLTLYRRFATGTYVLWYPLLRGNPASALRAGIDAAGIEKVLQFELAVAGRDSPGMHGCGVMVVNPPWTLQALMDTALPYLASRLGRQ